MEEFFLKKITTTVGMRATFFEQGMWVPVKNTRSM
jgi:hypothetical protein